MTKHEKRTIPNRTVISGHTTSFTVKQANIVRVIYGCGVPHIPFFNEAGSRALPQYGKHPCRVRPHSSGTLNEHYLREAIPIAIASLTYSLWAYIILAEGQPSLIKEHGLISQSITSPDVHCPHRVISKLAVFLSLSPDPHPNPVNRWNSHRRVHPLPGYH